MRKGRLAFYGKRRSHSSHCPLCYFRVKWMKCVCEAICFYWFHCEIKVVSCSCSMNWRRWRTNGEGRHHVPWKLFAPHSKWLFMKSQLFSRLTCFDVKLLDYNQIFAHFVPQKHTPLPRCHSFRTKRNPYNLTRSVMLLLCPLFWALGFHRSGLFNATAHRHTSNQSIDSKIYSRAATFHVKKSHRIRIQTRNDVGKV